MLQVYFQLLLQGTSFAEQYRGEHGIACSLRLLEHAVHDVLGGVFLYLLSADRTESPSHTGIEQAQVFVDFGRSAYGGTGIAAAYFLLDGNGRGDTLDEIAFGLTHTSQKLAGVTAEAFHIAPLPLGIECIECERGLAGTGQSGYDDQLVAGNFHINIFQIIDACPLYDDRCIFCHKTIENELSCKDNHYLCDTIFKKNKMKVRNLLLLLAFCCLSLAVQAQFVSTSAHPKREFRAAWIQAVNGQFRGIPTDRLKQILINQLNSLQGAGINAIIFQVRPEADALYASQYEPWSRFLTGVQGKAPEPYWDPMQFMIEECHKRSMEFHAWINPYRVKTSLKNELSPIHIYNSHPEWFVTYGDQLYFDPALPESRNHICKVITDIVSRYDVDAIHMDDYFYPYPIKGKDFPDDASFARYGGGFSNKADWRRSNVNILIQKIHETVRGLKPWVKFGVSPFGIYRNQSSDPLGSATNGLQNYDDLYADVLLWARKGWIDYNIPQVYWQIGHPAADYETLVKWWAKHTENRPLFIGQSVMNTVQNADPKNPSVNQLPRKMALQRAYQTIGGSCQWPASAVVENAGKYRDALVAEYHKYPALPPVFDFMDNEAPDKVRKVKPVWTADGYILFWTAPKFKDEMNRPVQYVVYRFASKEKVDIDDPSHIVAVTRNTFYKLPYEDGKTKYRYVVTALDRLHNESKSVSKKVKL